jgi:hypothetical protein
LADMNCDICEAPCTVASVMLERIDAELRHVSHLMFVHPLLHQHLLCAQLSLLPMLPRCL